MSFCCLRGQQALLQPRVTRGSRCRTMSAGRGQVPRTEEYANPRGQNTGRSCVAVMTNYREDPKTVIGHSLQLKNATRFFFFFDIVIHLYLNVLSLFALRTAGRRENDNVEGFYRPIVYLQKKIEHHPFRVGNR